MGCVTFGREIDQATSFDLLDHALERGINLLDTAEAYGGGQAREARRRQTGVLDEREASGEMHSSERIIGRWLRERRCRDRVILQTKVTPPLTAERIRVSIDASLRRLQTDVIDVMMLHAPDAGTPIDESLGALEAAREAGKVRAIGCSNFSAMQLSSALEEAIRRALPHFDVTQFNYNLAVRDAEKGLFETCRSNGVYVQTFSPLGAGFLTGKYQRGIPLPGGTRFDVLPAHQNVYFHDAKFQVVDQLRTLSSMTGLPMARLALAWVLSNPAVATIVVGARTRQHIDNAFDAAQTGFRPEWAAAFECPSQSKTVPI
jgi:aryl-alcohol dehydrogenase-like predicted oxidoreductase